MASQKFRKGGGERGNSAVSLPRRLRVIRAMSCFKKEIACMLTELARICVPTKQPITPLLVIWSCITSL
jgi:hypothetical protein